MQGVVEVTVHNHGPWDGPGIQCPENLVRGQLTGECIQPRPPDYLVAPHRPTCGCAYCVRPTVTAVINRGPDRDERRATLAGAVEHDLTELLADVPDDWHGGLEITEGPKQYHFGCKHLHRTTYMNGTFCRDCGRWVEPA